MNEEVCNLLYDYRQKLNNMLIVKASAELELKDSANANSYSTVLQNALRTASIDTAISWIKLMIADLESIVNEAHNEDE